MDNFAEYLDKALKKAVLYDTDSIPFLIGAEIRRVRKEKKITQKELSEITGIPQASISNIEAGKMNPSLRTIERILQALKVKAEIHLK